MAYDERLAERIRRVLAKRPDLDERKMFGGIAFMLGGHMACGALGDDLIVRLGTGDAEAALRRDHVRPMDVTGRPMRTMLFVAPEGVRTAAQLRRWVERAVAYVDALPPKDAPASRRRAPRAAAGGRDRLNRRSPRPSRSP